MATVKVRKHGLGLRPRLYACSETHSVAALAVWGLWRCVIVIPLPLTLPVLPLTQRDASLLLFVTLHDVCCLSCSFTCKCHNRLPAPRNAESANIPYTT